MTRLYPLLVALIVTLPQQVFAVGSIPYLIYNSTTFIRNTVVPFLLTIAFVILVYNVFRYFVAGSANAESQQNARTLAIYSVAAFVFIVIFWGIIALLVDSIGLDRQEANIPDYLEKSGY